MTAQPAETGPAAVKDFAPTSKRKVLTFTLEGHPLTARQPKTAWQLALHQKYAGQPEDDVAYVILEETMAKVFDADSLAHLRARLADDDDDFDFEDLQAMARWCREQWADGDPTGSSTGSSGRRQTTGGRSTARRR